MCCLVPTSLPTRLRTQHSMQTSAPVPFKWMPNILLFDQPNNALDLIVNRSAFQISTIDSIVFIKTFGNQLIQIEVWASNIKLKIWMKLSGHREPFGSIHNVFYIRAMEPCGSNSDHQSDRHKLLHSLWAQSRLVGNQLSARNPNIGLSEWPPDRKAVESAISANLKSALWKIGLKLKNKRPFNLIYSQMSML